MLSMADEKSHPNPYVPSGGQSQGYAYPPEQSPPPFHATQGSELGPQDVKQNPQQNYSQASYSQTSYHNNMQAPQYNTPPAQNQYPTGQQQYSPPQAGQQPQQYFGAQPNQYTPQGQTQTVYVPYAQQSPPVVVTQPSTSSFLRRKSEADDVH